MSSERTSSYESDLALDAEERGDAEICIVASLCMIPTSETNEVILLPGWDMLVFRKKSDMRGDFMSGGGWRTQNRLT